METTVRATYRVQLTPTFGFADAAAIVPYLADLGVSHLYTSPLAEATPGSTHGYDVTDHQKVRDELGGEEELRRLWAVLAEHGMGQVLDLVPNHMGIRDVSNRWWQDVLAHGTDSQYAHHFDIDWADERCYGKVLLPFLDRPLDAAIRDGAIRVERRPDTPELVVRHHGDRWPASDRSLELLGLSAGDCAERVEGTLDGLHRDPAAMATFLDAQNWRAAHWREASRSLNWRRFFDVTDLASVSIERPEVFDDVHALLRSWMDDPLAAEVVQGVRIDHVDGLVDPEGYLQRLREVVGPDRLVVVEKILAADEELPASWPVGGTTGYEVVARIDEALTWRPGADRLTAAFDRHTGQSEGWHAVEAGSRRLVAHGLLVPETERVARAFEAAAAVEGEAPSAPVALDVVRELAVEFDVYRTYPRPGTAGLDDEGRRRVDAAVDRLRRRRPDLPSRVVDLAAALLSRRRGQGSEADRFAARFNQLTAPLAAKAVEDTAFYRYVPCAWMNEVGGDPSTPGRPVGELHDVLGRMVEGWPGTFTPLTTHDTKRGADVRARLGRLSERPDEFARAVAGWDAVAHAVDEGQSGGASTGPDPCLAWLLWQVLVGAWPLDLERVDAYATKAMREAKAHTSWLDPVDAYEQAVHAFLERVLGDGGLRASLESFAASIRRPGRAAALAQVVLAATAVGTPDVYQGDELWNLVLVDPDNRRPVDYDRRRAVLAEVAALDGAALTERWSTTADDPDDDGTVKLAVLHRLLDLRAGDEPVLAAGSSYRPLVAEGPDDESVLGYLRGDRLAVVVPRRFMDPLDATVTLPEGRWTDVLSGATVEGGPQTVAGLTAALPAAVLVRS